VDEKDVLDVVGEGDEWEEAGDRGSIFRAMRGIPRYSLLMRSCEPMIVDREE
jgi:hypothetical protein